MKRKETQLSYCIPVMPVSISKLMWIGKWEPLLFASLSDPEPTWARTEAPRSPFFCGIALLCDPTWVGCSECGLGNGALSVFTPWPVSRANAPPVAKVSLYISQSHVWDARCGCAFSVISSVFLLCSQHLRLPSMSRWIHLTGRSARLGLCAFSSLVLDPRDTRNKLSRDISTPWESWGRCSERKGTRGVSSIVGGHSQWNSKYILFFPLSSSQVLVSSIFISLVANGSKSMYFLHSSD